MNVKSRIASIAKATNIDVELDGIESFSLSQLKMNGEVEFPLPTNLRLGHLAESIVSGLIEASCNYHLLYENVQLIQEKRTIGEMDFILEEVATKRVIHLELAYKFYLFDPNNSAEPLKNWIGPNRNDSLAAKLSKLKEKQFPLLYHSCTKSVMNDIAIGEVSQALCLLASLYIPYDYQGSFPSRYSKAVKGHYVNFKTFVKLDHTKKLYAIPDKREWGMEPGDNESWHAIEDIKSVLSHSIEEKQSVLCWQKHGEETRSFFVVWW